MRSRKQCTSILAEVNDRSSRRSSISYRLLRAIVAFILVGAIGAAGFGAYHFTGVLFKLRDYDRLLTENDAFRSENHNYRIQTAQLGEKLDFLETTSRKLMIISGMNGERNVGGVGGFSKGSFSQPLPATAGTLQAIDRYNRSFSSLEERYRGLEEYFSERAVYDAAIPAFLPVRGYVTGGLGRREDPFKGGMKDYHTGVDISAPYGTRVISPADGTVLFAGYREGYGNIVVLDHKFGLITRYGHLFKFNVQVGQHVSRYDVIGYVGNSGRSTGPHLHFELWVANNPIDPQKFFIRGKIRP